MRNLLVAVTIATLLAAGPSEAGPSDALARCASALPAVREILSAPFVDAKKIAGLADNTDGILSFSDDVAVDSVDEQNGRVYCSVTTVTDTRRMVAFLQKFLHAYKPRPGTSIALHVRGVSAINSRPSQFTIRRDYTVEESSGGPLVTVTRSTDVR